MNRQLVVKSKERKEYLKTKKKKKILVLFTQIFILIAFLTIWEILANKGIIDNMEYINKFRFTRPNETYMGNSI